MSDPITPEVQNPEFQKAIDIATDTDKHLFISGPAGTGKSTLLKYLRNHVLKQKVVLAPTGLAAINVEGQTIHSFFRLPPSGGQAEAEKSGRQLRKSKLIQNLEMLIIDEISMVRADMIDMIDTVLRTARDDISPFGGVQVIMIGDLYQLPPVVRQNEAEILGQQYRSPYFFSSRVFNYLLSDLGNNLIHIGLKEIFRQKDSSFIDLLNKIRHNRASVGDLEILNKHVEPEWVSKNDNHIILTTRNVQATRLNIGRLSEIKNSEKTYIGEIDGQFKEYNLPTDLELKLKPGSRVMFVKNHMNGDWVNGTLGTVQELHPEYVDVLIDGGKLVEVGIETWNMYKAVFDPDTRTIENETIGSFMQIPLKLSWAITIHKSQGQTFEKVILDLGRGAFSTGQTYVALSRCTSLDGLMLVRDIRPTDIKTDQRVTRFLDYLKQNEQIWIRLYNELQPKPLL